MSEGFLTTHVLDTALGKPAAGLTIELYRLEDLDGDGIADRALLARLTTNDDGRTDRPILSKMDFDQGEYELVFYAGDYLDAHEAHSDSANFLDIIPIRFTMDEDDHYHVPLLLSPFGYSTYRGS